MNDESANNGVFPTPESEPVIALGWRDRALVEAAAMDRDRAVVAWGLLRDDPGLTKDPGSRNLLPNIYLNLRRLEIDDPRIDPLRAVYGEYWASNLLAQRSAVMALTALRESGVEAIAMKGLPLLLTCYRCPGARPMHDLDLLVSPEQRVAGRAALMAAGWSSSGMPDALAPFLHGEAFQHQRWKEIDLHWRPFSVISPVQAEAGLWMRARRIPLEGMTVAVPSTEDLLIMVCYNAFKRDSQAPARYALDLIELIRGPGRTMDWEAVFTFARAADLLLPVRDCLLYVEKEFGPLLPSQGLLALSNIRIDRVHHARATRTFRALRRRPSGLVSRLLEHWQRHRQVRMTEGGTGMAGFLRYLKLHYQYYWRHQNLRSLVREALRRRNRLRSAPDPGVAETPDRDDRS